MTAYMCDCFLELCYMGSHTWLLENTSQFLEEDAVCNELIMTEDSPHITMQHYITAF